MSSAAQSVPEAVERLSRHDPGLEWINLASKRHTDSELAELVDCMLAHPDVVVAVNLTGNRLTDETGVKLARYLAASSTVRSLYLYNNQLGEATYLAVAAALRVNTSIGHLGLRNNRTVDQTCVEAEFIEALRLNPDRPDRSAWWLFSPPNDFERLKQAAEQLGHPSLQQLLSQIC